MPRVGFPIFLYKMAAKVKMTLDSRGDQEFSRSLRGIKDWSIAAFGSKDTRLHVKVGHRL